MQCQNNLKQIGFGLVCTIYHDTLRRFPASFYRAWPTSVGGTFGTPGWGWGTMILPQIEQSALFNSLNVGTNRLSANPAVKLLAQTSLPFYRCPCDTGQALNANRANFATSNYMAVFGALYDQAAPSPGALVYAAECRHWCLFSETAAFASPTSPTARATQFLIGEMNYGPNGVRKPTALFILITAVSGSVLPMIRSIHPMCLVNFRCAVRLQVRMLVSDESIHRSAATRSAALMSAVPSFASATVLFVSSAKIQTGVMIDRIADRADGQVCDPRMSQQRIMKFLPQVAYGEQSYLWGSLPVGRLFRHERRAALGQGQGALSN